MALGSIAIAKENNLTIHIYIYIITIYIIIYIHTTYHHGALVVKCCVGVAGVLGWRAQNSAVCKHIYQSSESWPHKRFRRILA